MKKSKSGYLKRSWT